MQYDIAIIGGGMVGSTLALALAKSKKYRIALIESLAVGHNNYDKLGLALSYRSILLLRQLGIWDKLDIATTDIQEVHVSEQGCLGQIHWQADKLNLPQIGCVVEGAELTKALQEQVFHEPYISTYFTHRVYSIHFDKTNYTWKFELKNQVQNKKISSQFMVGADGVHSCVRQSLGIDICTKDYRQAAIIANIQCVHPHNKRAYKRFLSDQSLALVPFEKQTMKSIWIMNASYKYQNLELNAQNYIASLEKMMANRIKIQAVGQRFAYPLMFKQANRLYYQQAVLVGNAATLLHPIVAQGFNLALRDIFELVSVLTDNWSEQLFKKYEQNRLKDHQQTALLIERLIRTFNQKSWLFKKFRSMGMGISNIMPGLKQLVFEEIQCPGDSVVRGILI